MHAVRPGRNDAARQPRAPLRPARTALSPRPSSRVHAARAQPAVHAAPLRARRAAARPGAGPVPSSLQWLRSADGVLQTADGTSLRLLGVRLALEAQEADLAQVHALLEGVQPGSRCVSLQLSRTAPLAEAALPALDARIDAWAAAGVYTLLRFDAQLWQRGHHLRLARRYANEAAVLYALAGRAPLAERLWQAALALRAVHPRAMVWLPLESAAPALRVRMADGLGLLWDATRPQSLRTPALSRSVLHPLLLDGWEVDTRNPLVHERLMALCRQGHVGWLAHSSAGWFGLRQGRPVPGRAVHALQRAIHQSLVSN